MRVWIENPFDTLPLEGARPLRFWLMAAAFARAGHEVVYWTGDFNHITKRKRDFSREGGSGERISRGGAEAQRGEAPFPIEMIPTKPYAKNVGWARVRSHRAYAAAWARRALPRAAADGAPDVIILSSPPLATGAAAIRLARRFGAKLVVDVMDDWPGTFYRLLPRGVRWLGRLLFAPAHRAARRLYRAADLVTTVAERYVELVRASGATAPVKLFYHGIELGGRGRLGLGKLGDLGRLGKLEKLETLGTLEPLDTLEPSRQLRLVYIGNLGRTYDLATILAAMDALPPTVTLDIAGNGEQFAELQRRATDRIRVHGVLDGARLAALLAQCDVGLVPMAESSCVGVPYKFGDYAAAGLAIASTLGGESGRLLARYGAGFAYRGGDAASLVALVQRLLAEPQTLASAQAAARRMAEGEFDADRIYAAYVAAVEAQVKNPVAGAVEI